VSNVTVTSQEIAQACAKVMLDADSASSGQGIELLQIAPGQATMQMTVKPHQTNGLGICHGGFIFMLADSCFAFACNSYNQRAVAAGASIEFIAPAFLSDVLEAKATETAINGRTGHYEITVIRKIATTAQPNAQPHNTERALIALFKGRSATIKGQLIEQPINTDTAK
jgi:phenylacetic acid degradation protein PaaD